MILLSIIYEQIDNLLNKLECTPLKVNRLDYYGNSISLGAFCFQYLLYYMDFMNLYFFRILTLFLF